MKLTKNHVKWSIIIPNYKGGQIFNNLITLLIEIIGNSNTEGELIIVNDGIEDQKYLVKLAKTKNSYIKVYTNLTRKGAAFSRNFGAKKAKGEILIFLDNDCFPIGNYFLDEIIKLISIDPNSYAVSGNIISQLESNDIGALRFDTLSPDKPINITYINPGFLQTGCFAVSKKIFEKTRGFNQDLNYFEDVEMGHKLAQKGILIVKSNKVTVLHRDSKLTLKREINKTFKAYQGSFQELVAEFPNASENFFWGDLFTRKNNLIIKIKYNKLTFQVMKRIFLCGKKIFPVRYQIELYDYLHRCAIYSAINLYKNNKSKNFYI